MKRTSLSLRHAVFLMLCFALTAAAQAAKFPGGTFKGNDGTNIIALDFDSTGTLTAYVNGEAFSTGTWSAKADTLTIGPVSGPEGYSCADSSRFLWSWADNRMTFRLLNDDCAVRRDALVGLVWTR